MCHFQSWKLIHAKSCKHVNVTTVTTQVPINANKVKKRKKQRTILSSWGISQPCLDALPTLGCVALGATLATFVGPASQCNNASFQGYQSTMYLHSNAAIHAQTWCNMVSWSAARSTSRTGDRLPGIRIPEQHLLSFCLAANSICPAHQTKQNPKVTQHYSTE